MPLSQAEKLMALKALAARKVRLESQEANKQSAHDEQAKRDRVAAMRAARAARRARNAPDHSYNDAVRQVNEVVTQPSEAGRPNWQSHPQGSDMLRERNPPDGGLRGGSARGGGRPDAAVAEELELEMMGGRRAIVLPNGASLRQVYDKKAQDVWGKIAKAQSVQNEEEHERNEQRKRQAHVDYLDKLTRQIEANNRRREEQRRRDEALEVKGYDYAKRWEARQQELTKHRLQMEEQFKSQAEEDIAIIQQRRAVERRMRLEQEREYARAAREALEQERREKEKKKRAEKEMLDRMKAENDRILERRRQAKLEQWRKDKEMNEAHERKLEEQEAARVAAFGNRVSGQTQLEEQYAMSVQEEIRLKNKQADEMMLKYQAERWKAIEDRERERQERQKRNTITQRQTLDAQVAEQREVRQKARQEDVTIGRQMVEADQRLVEAEKRKAQQRVAAHQRYVQQIEAQVEDARRRKFNELVGEMSPREREWQSTLLRQTGALATSPMKQPSGATAS